MGISFTFQLLGNHKEFPIPFLLLGNPKEFPIPYYIFFLISLGLCVLNWFFGSELINILKDMPGLPGWSSIGSIGPGYSLLATYFALVATSYSFVFAPILRMVFQALCLILGWIAPPKEIKIEKPSSSPTSSSVDKTPSPKNNPSNKKVVGNESSKVTQPKEPADNQTKQAEQKILNDPFNSTNDLSVETIKSAQQKLVSTEKAEFKETNANPNSETSSIKTKGLAEQANQAFEDVSKDVDEITNTLRELGDPELVSQIAQIEKILINKRNRSAHFVFMVRQSYNCTCAVSESQVYDLKGKPEIEVAHIYPKSLNGSDDPRNGICLSRFYHWAFDRGLFSLTDDHRVLVHPKVASVALTKYSGKRIFLPSNKDVWPNEIYLSAHRKLHGFDSIPTTFPTFHF